MLRRILFCVEHALLRISGNTVDLTISRRNAPGGRES